MEGGGPMTRKCGVCGGDIIISDIAKGLARQQKYHKGECARIAKNRRNSESRRMVRARMDDPSCSPPAPGLKWLPCLICDRYFWTTVDKRTCNRKSCRQRRERVLGHHPASYTLGPAAI